MTSKKDYRELNKHLRKDPVYQKLEKIITRDWWEDGDSGKEFREKEFKVYCQAIQAEAKILGSIHTESFVSGKSVYRQSKEYNEFLEMDEFSLRNYFEKMAGY